MKVVLVVLVGKGIMFDMGGILLKLGEGMDEMKYDMCGVGLVFGMICVVVEMGLKINVVVIVLICENMLGGNVMKLGDIVISMKGLMIEVLNIDVEGCLILCDVFMYVECFKLVVVIDVVMLMGVCVIVLGGYNSGLFLMNDVFVGELFDVLCEVNDLVWCMLFDDEY